MTSLSRRPPRPHLGNRLPGAGLARKLRELMPSLSIIGLAALFTVTYGRFVADGKTKYGIAIILLCLFGPLVLYDMPLAFALFTAIIFFKDIRAFSKAPNSMGVLIWLGFFGTTAPRLRHLPVLRQQRRLLIVLICFMLWLTLSITWAHDAGTAGTWVAYWWLGALALVIAMVLPHDKRAITLVAFAFVLGAAIAAVIGLGSGGLSTVSTAAAVTSETTVEGRLTGGGGDPNLQAAGFVAAIFICMGLSSIYRTRLARLGLACAFVVITIAFFLTQSRGGLLSLAVCTVGAMFVFPDQRRRIAGFVLLGGVIALIAVAANPGALARITDFGGGTSGRNDIWAVAVQVFLRHPFIGVGMNNFPVVEPRFALLHMDVTRVQYITGSAPYPAHNTYLQLAAETGIIGLAGFLTIIVMSLRSGYLAARLFDEIGEHAYGNLAKTTFMGALGMLASIFFISDGQDWRVWILLGLGPAMLALARKHAALAEQSHQLPLRI
jgi:O-antigen ligase